MKGGSRSRAADSRVRARVHGGDRQASPAGSTPGPFRALSCDDGRSIRDGSDRDGIDDFKCAASFRGRRLTFSMATFVDFLMVVVGR